MNSFALSRVDPPANWNFRDLLLIVVIGLVPRIWFWPPTLVGLDSIGFAVGGLGPMVAHPPGYFGICFLASLINQVIGDIKDSLVLLNLICSHIAIVAVYRLCQWTGLTRQWVFLAAASYALSINVLYNSLAPLSYASEAACGAVVGLLAFVAARTGYQRWVLAATLAWAVSGFFRQTSCFVLAPLILLVLVLVVPWRLWLVHALLGFAICWGWTATNTHYMNAMAGAPSKVPFSSSLWSTQIMMESAYDPSNLSMSTRVDVGKRSGFHWPGVEYLAIIDEHLGMGLLPDWRPHSSVPPDLGHATRMATNQAAKVLYFLVFSLPALLIVGPLLVHRVARRGLLGSTPSKESRGLLLFWVIWSIPSMALYILGQMGPPGYLLVFLPAWVVGLGYFCNRATANEHRNHDGPLGWLRWGKAHFALTSIGLVFFAVASPFRSSDSREQLADVIALQFTGDAIVRSYCISRGHLAGPKDNLSPPWTYFTNDREIVAWWRNKYPDSPAKYPPREK